MEVIEQQTTGEPWHWAVEVESGNIVKRVELEPGGIDGKLESLFNASGPTIDMIFSLANGCATRGFMDCGLDFDSRFHFPTKIDSYDLFIIKIERFVECKATTNPCWFGP